MALELQDTVLNQSPYWDDFDETNNYHRVLFRPGVAVQARELTQLQTILQNQIERFGENIFKVGTVIKGCTQSFDSNYQYVKILDNQVDGQPCNMDLYANTLVVGTANLQAYVVNTVAGLQTQDPDLNTLYVKYLNTGTGGEKVFTTGTTLTCYHRDRRVESISVALGGTGYSNTDTISFTAVNGGSGAQATVVTYANGTIKEVLMTEKGSGYLEAPTLGITTTNGAGASLLASVEIAQLSIANSFYTESVGTGYAMHVSDGVIFQKGHFVRFGGGTAIVAKYTTAPNNAIVGFTTTETVANTTSDPSLLDNAAGALNYKAPGAHRLKLTPQLVVKTKTDAASNSSFFSIVEFENGKKVKQNEQTEYNVIGNQLARRTYEESGNYVVSRFSVATESITGNTTHINAAVGSGVAYVEGHRVEILDNIRVPLRKATNTTIDYSQSISTNYGNYVLVKEMSGSFNGSIGVSVSLRNTAGQSITTNLGGTPASPGSQIGTAKIRAIEYESGDVGSPSAVYRLYLFDVTMSVGHSFAEVRAVSVASTACADIVLNQSNVAEIYEGDYNCLVFGTGTRAISSLNNENFVYRAQTSLNGLFNTSGVATVTLAGAEEFPYTPSSTLNNTQERDFVIIPTNSTYGSAKTGNVQTFGNTTVQANTGSTTAFLTEYNVGESIRIAGANYTIARIISDSKLEVSASVGAGTSQAHYIAFPAYTPISTFNRPGAGITIDSLGTTATISLGSNIGTLNAQINGVIHFNAKVVGANIVGATQATKSITKSVYVKLSGSALSATPNGPWCLGLPDVHKLVGVYKGTSTSYSEATDVTSSFVIDNGQSDNLYGLSYLKKKVGASLNLTSSDNLLVKVDVYTRNSGYYLSAESYPVDDATTPLPSNKIRTEEIELYTTASGKTMDLRDSLDFRPAVSNTANVATTIAGATVDPSASASLPGTTVYFPAPNETFEADVTSYMPRIDRITLDSKGQLRIAEGTPSNQPTSPVEPAGAMTLALVQVPPYPTLPIPEARAVNRPDLATTVSLTQQRRYTMKDIQDIESRIARLEYYSLLNALEQNTKNLVIPSQADPTVDRFKNGFFVDPFDNYNIANTNDPEYSMFIDIYNSEARPVINQYNIELEYKASLNDANTALTGDTATLAYSEVEFVSQPFATKYRNCVENSYNYKGRVFTFPAYDNHYDTTTTPQTIDIDIAGAIAPVVNSVNEALNAIGGKVTITSQRINENVIGTSSTWGGGGVTTRQTLDQTIQSTGTLTTATIGASYGESTDTVGNYVTNFALLPYIRPQVIKVAAVGLRPGAKHYVFFDKKNVTAYCQPAVVPSSTTFSDESFYVQGQVADDIIATDEGVVSFVFYLPANMFMVGERELVVLDVADLDSQTAAASRAIGSFNAYNFTVDKQALSMNTKTVNSVKTTIETTPYVSTTRGVVTRTSFVAVPPSDPIAQSFKVQSPEPGTDGVVITSIDLFFQRKDPNQGAVVEIREMLLGTPTTTVLPNATTRLPSSLIYTSADATQPTTFTFPSPVYLKADAEYAFVVYPEGGSPEYLIWTGESGGVDVANTSLVKKSDWGLGAMFLSTNGSTWAAYQFEDVKFTMKRAKFSQTAGTVTLTPKGYEFLNVSGQSGLFTPGERVAQKSATYGPGVVYANTSTRTLTGSSTSYAVDLAVGDQMLIVYGTSKTTAKTGTVAGGTSSGVITGTGTDFTNDYAVGDYVQIGNYVREIIAIANTTQMTVESALRETLSGTAHYGVTPKFAVGKVLAIGSSTSVTLDIAPPIDSTSTSGVVANYQKVVSGIVDNYNGTTSLLMLKDSNAANSTFKFVAGNGIVGGQSQAEATISSVDNIGISYIEPHIQTFIPPATSTTFNMTVTRTSNNQLVTMAGEYGISNRVPFVSTIKSRSNEISGLSIVNSFVYQQQISTVATNLSPLVDTYPGSILVVENIVDNYIGTTITANTFANTILQTNTASLAVGMSVGGLGITDGTVITSIDGSNCTLSIAAANTVDQSFVTFTSNEHKVYGISKNRYISKRLALADGLDAEDIRVLITAYRPQGTEIEIYAKIMNGTDADNFTSKDWSKLVFVTGEDIRSDSLNPFDYREYEYTFDTAPPGVRITGTGRTDVSSNTSNTTVEGFGTAFDNELNAGDFIRLVRTTDETLYDVRRINSITDYNTLVLDNAPSFTADGIKIYKITQPLTAFKYKDNDSIVRYYNSNGSYFDGYKYMALKIVLRASSSAVVPTVQDVRALAISI